MSHLPPDLSSSESESYNCGRCLLWPAARHPHLASVCTAKAEVEDRAPCLGGPADTRDAKPTRVCRSNAQQPGLLTAGSSLGRWKSLAQAPSCGFPA